jgi:hypothetical protein
MSFGYNWDIAFTSAAIDIEDVATILLDRLDGERKLKEKKVLSYSYRIVSAESL